MNELYNYSQNISDLLKGLQVTDSSGKIVDAARAVKTSVKAILDCAASRGKLIFIGNGGSASLAGHQAVDFWKNGGIRAVSFNEPSLLTCVSNDYGYEHVFGKPVSMFADKGDILVAISSSGKSKNIVNAAAEAAKLGCEVITMSGFSGNNPLRKMGHVNFFVDSDSYGFVEIAHLTICHCVLDTIIKKRNAKK